MTSLETVMKPINRPVTVLVFALVTACSASSPMDHGSPATHFEASATQWPVPARGTSFGFAELGAPYWAVIDIDGDGKSDLVYTEDSDSNGVWGGDGAAYWKVFKNTGSGFSPSATQWSVPMRGVSGGFAKVSGQYWALTDIDGDGKPDLVYTEDGDSNGVWGGDGAAYWKVFKNTGTGFSSSATRWSVPVRGNSFGFSQVSAMYWALTDLDGDGKPDLVYTDDSDSSGVWGGDGAAYWKVFKNTGSGFSSSATRWSVPVRGNSSGFLQVSALYWALTDLDGDGKLDLVYTDDLDSNGVWGGDAAAYWKVFKNTGSGFSSSVTKWSVPVRGNSFGFAHANSQYWTVTDFDGDGKPDLVSSGDIDSNGVWGGNGSAYWNVFSNTDTGFSPEASRWGVPARGTSTGFDQVRAEYWGVLDLEGNGTPDLVYTDDGDSNGVWGGDGNAYWKIFRGAR